MARKSNILAAMSGGGKGGQLYSLEYRNWGMSWVADEMHVDVGAGTNMGKGF